MKDRAGCLGPRLFVGEPYVQQHYYVAGAAKMQKEVLQRVMRRVQQRGPKDVIAKVTEAARAAGSEPRDVISVRWSIGYGYVVCFAPGNDLFLSVRLNFAPGCIARLIAPFSKLEPNIFGVDDLNMLSLCLVRTVEEELDACQLQYTTYVDKQ
ncbi:MAG: hypothetical protein JSW59_08040 [Phycisphaerales bacterium]|nr:MAG: hypothetical protein JSW59_08040 [Phycisphaerales bacterium]